MKHNLKKINEELFEFLEKEYQLDNNLRFTLRKSNRGNKLEQGYWFYGNDKYIAISFWTGMDYKNKTPNIYFGILDDGRTYLEIAVSDSEFKREFIKSILISEYSDKIKFEVSGPRYIKYYNELDYRHSFREFLTSDKVILDQIISTNQYFFDNKKEDRIGFIGYNEFEDSLRKIRSYRYNEISHDRTSSQQILNFQIQNYGPIIDTTLIKIPHGTQWIFFVGENGTGKTSLLRGLASGLCHIKTQDENYNFKVSLSDLTEGTVEYTRYENEGIRKRKPIVSGLCTYGASRLRTSYQFGKKFSIKSSLNKHGLVKSLFDIDSVLIDIQDQLNIWDRNPDQRNMAEKRKVHIRELLIDLLPNVYNIIFNEQTSWQTYYIEMDERGSELPHVTFDQLSSGLKSLIAMIGDLMMRLFNQQPEIIDPSELTGIVIIDEIDIHLHPKLQKFLVEQLTITFPKVQFIAATHSPIPLLGTPNNSCFFKVIRNKETGVELVDLTEISVFRLLPNSILTSDLFGMSKLFSRNNRDEEIRTENFYDEIADNDKIKKELLEIASRLRNTN